jgi:cbb3-type cytochrome oxidase subunit 1
MGQTLSIDVPTNILFGVVMVIVGVVTILQIAHLALPNKQFTGKTFYALPRRLRGYHTNHSRIITEEEHGLAAAVEMVVSTTGSLDQYQPQPEQSSIINMAVPSIVGSTPGGTSVGSWEEPIALLPAIEVLLSVGARFAEVENEDWAPKLAFGQ